MAIPTHNPEYEARKEAGKKLIAAGGCAAIKFWSNTDAIRLCPDEHRKELDFQPLEAPIYAQEWTSEGRKAVDLISRGIALIERDWHKREAPPTPIKEEPEETHEGFCEDHNRAYNGSCPDCDREDIPEEILAAFDELASLRSELSTLSRERDEYREALEETLKRLNGMFMTGLPAMVKTQAIEVIEKALAKYPSTNKQESNG